MDIFTVRDSLERWITSSTSAEQLAVCRDLIHNYITWRFIGLEKPIIIKETVAYLNHTINEHEKLLPAVAAGVVSEVLKG